MQSIKGQLVCLSRSGEEEFVEVRQIIVFCGHLKTRGRDYVCFILKVVFICPAGSETISFDVCSY